MPKSTPVVFKKSLLAVAVLSVSACSTMPQVPDLGGVGDGIVNAGKATADVSRRTWNATAYLLGFTDTKDGNKVANPSEEQLQVAETEVDQVLPLAELPPPETTSFEDALKVDDSLPVLVEQATAPAIETEALEPLDETPDTLGTVETTTSILDETVEIAVTTVESSTGDSLAADDLIHEVAANENLWNIAKKTTGDANNWHVLADVNNLTQSAMVFPGQKLIIPSSMIAPGSDTVAASLESDQSEAITATQNLDSAPAVELAESARLAIPTDTGIAASDTTQTDQSIIEQEAAIELAAISEDAAAIDLKEGETLWDFAKRTTGNALNWQAIANQNNFTEKQAVTVRPGQTIFVPQVLLKAERDTSTSASAPTVDVQTPLEDVVQTAAMPAETTPVVLEHAAAALPAPTLVETDSPVIENTASLTVETDSPVIENTASLTVETESPAIENTASLTVDTTTIDDPQPIKIVEATYKTDDELTPITAQDEPVQVVENENIPANVVVSGTYYPKAVYNNADFSSSLLMRVSPGTTLQVSRAMGTWFEVETEKGVGFVHQRDIQ